MLILFSIAVLVFVNDVRSVLIDNGVEGEPEIECGASGISINFNTKNNFEGHVYVKSHFNEPGCKSDEGGRRVASLNIPFTACGTERIRSLNPRGIYVKQNVVITFHPQFLTKIDRAYTVQCFYMEADKTVSQEMEVSGISTLFQSQVAPMPMCRYEILDGGATGQPVKFATIGQQVYHKWTCDTETTDMFCMVVNTCHVDDGAGNRATLLNENGCGLDKHLLQHLEYTTDLIAGRESFVFKFADRVNLFFTCQIAITIKEPAAQCPRPQCTDLGSQLGVPTVTGVSGSSPSRRVEAPAPPVYQAPQRRTQQISIAAPKPQLSGIGSHKVLVAAPPAPPVGQKLRDSAKVMPRRRFIREVDISEESFTMADPGFVGMIDVQAQPITALDIDPNSDQSQLKSTALEESTFTLRREYCMAPAYVSLLLALTVSSSLAAVAVFAKAYYLRRRSNKSQGGVV